MANQEYKLIDHPYLKLNGINYQVIASGMNLENFLKENPGKQIYILQSSILTENIRAIVI